jgi:hypothetical protein
MAPKDYLARVALRIQEMHPGGSKARKSDMPFQLPQLNMLKLVRSTIPSQFPDLLFDVAPERLI